MTAAEAVRESVALLVKRPLSDLGDEKRLAEDLNVRSMARIELAVLLEDKLHRPVKDAVVQRAKTIGDLITAIGP